MLLGIFFRIYSLKAPIVIACWDFYAMFNLPFNLELIDMSLLDFGFGIVI